IIPFRSISLYVFILVVFISIPYYGIILDGDELHSIIFSSGNREYFNAGYAGLMDQQVTALEWKKQLSEVANFDLLRVWNDTLLYDVHPPLYYCLLHIVLFLCGGSLIGAYLLNAIFLLASLHLISSKRNLDFSSNWKIIAFLPFILNGCLDIRPYCILFYFGLQCYFMLREQKFSYLKLSCFILLGILTNYLFSLFIIALVVARIQGNGLNLKSVFKSKNLILAVFLTFILGYFLLGHNEQFSTITNRIDFDQHFIFDKFTNIIFSIVGITFPLWLFKLANYFSLYCTLFVLGSIVTIRLMRFVLRHWKGFRFEITGFLLYLFFYLVLYFLEIIPHHSVGGKYFLLLSIPLILPFMKMLEDWKHLKYILPFFLFLILAGEALFRGDERKYISLLTQKESSFYSNSNDAFTVLRLVNAMDDDKKVFIGNPDKIQNLNFDQLFVVTYKKPHIRYDANKLVDKSYSSKPLVLRKFYEVGTFYHR
ncbi:MAG: hypothetical protein ACKVH5_06890, partial [Fidelibacterota bacterium]